MDEREQRSFIHFLVRELKAYTRELMAYQLLAHTLKEAGVLGVQELLDQARQSPELQVKLDENFADFDAILPLPDPDQSEMVKELLAKWKPKDGPLN